MEQANRQKGECSNGTYKSNGSSRMADSLSNRFSGDPNCHRSQLDLSYATCIPIKIIKQNNSLNFELTSDNNYESLFEKRKYIRKFVKKKQ